MQNVKRPAYNLLLMLCILCFAISISSCSIPNLEDPQCAAARDAVKKFYSFHFGGDMSSSSENVMARVSYLSSDLIQILSATAQTRTDYFTATDNYPKAFRVGECTFGSVDSSTLQVLLLWRDDKQTDQKEVFVETVRVGDKWLINKVSN